MSTEERSDDGVGRDLLCWDRGPRIGADGTRCFRVKGHAGSHQAHKSFGNVTWPQWADELAAFPAAGVGGADQ